MVSAGAHEREPDATGVVANHCSLEGTETTQKHLGMIRAAHKLGNVRDRPSTIVRVREQVVEALVVCHIHLGMKPRMKVGDAKVRNDDQVRPREHCANSVTSEVGRIHLRHGNGRRHEATVRAGGECTSTLEINRHDGDGQTMEMCLGQRRKA